MEEERLDTPSSRSNTFTNIKIIKARLKTKYKIIIDSLYGCLVSAQRFLNNTGRDVRYETELEYE